VKDLCAQGAFYLRVEKILHDYRKQPGTCCCYPASQRLSAGSSASAAEPSAAAVLVLGLPEEDDAEREERHASADGDHPEVVVGDNILDLGLTGGLFEALNQPTVEKLLTPPRACSQATTARPARKPPS
jgi:hypothetical protein